MEEKDLYKQLKQEFVSNHNGTSVAEIEVMTLGGPLGVLLRNFLIWWLFPIRYQNLHYSVKFVLDFFLLILTNVFCFTVLADQATAVLLAVFLTSLGLAMVGQQLMLDQTQTTQTPSVREDFFSIPMGGKRPFITHYRAYVNMASCLGILAVDFAVYPRRFCKAETYGTGLMDVGVGSFILSNAIVCPEARGKDTKNKSLQGALLSICKSVVSTWPLLALGAARLLAVKSTDYQEHVSEYGVHWNFFFTLAVVRVLSSIVFSFVDGRYSLLLSIATAVGYQWLLTRHGLVDVVLHGTDGGDSRDGWFNANREGICSCFGYLSLFLAGVQLGQYLLKPRQTTGDWVKAWCVLLIVDIFLWTVHQVCVITIEDTSRRLANLTFVVWMLGFTVAKLVGFLAVDLIWTLFQAVVLGQREGPRGFCLLEAVNRNGLFYFLLANLLTGAVNFSMNTLLTPPATSVLVLVGYMFVLSFVVAVLHVQNISLKFW